jgi:hypothetical protein
MRFVRSDFETSLTGKTSEVADLAATHVRHETALIDQPRLTRALRDPVADSAAVVCILHIAGDIMGLRRLHRPLRRWRASFLHYY